MKTTMIALLFGMAGSQMSVAGELVKASDCQGAAKLADGSIRIKSFDGPNGKMTDMRIGLAKPTLAAPIFTASLIASAFLEKASSSNPPLPGEA
jgi:hypothetical protein